jgi:hypothetical protein
LVTRCPWRLGGFRQAWKRRLPRNLRVRKSGAFRLNGTHRERKCQRRDKDRGKAFADDILTCATGA